jgi:hypothetical protein
MNGNDYRMAGYSFDLCLSDLQNVSSSKKAIAGLSQALRQSLKHRNLRLRSLLQERIILAHWDAQSYWKENYIDLYDFCKRLHERCLTLVQLLEKSPEPSPLASEKEALYNLNKACEKVLETLEQGYDNLVIAAGFVGPAYQYSHGFSVFFPWSEPTNKAFFNGRRSSYGSYRFESTTWRKFLNVYFESTMRATRGEEEAQNDASGHKVRDERPRMHFWKEISRFSANGSGPNGSVQLSNGQLAFASSVQPDGGKGGGNDVTGPGDIKGGPGDPTGDNSCDCPSIKNYPSFARLLVPDAKAK